MRFPLKTSSDAADAFLPPQADGASIVSLTGGTGGRVGSDVERSERKRRDDALEIERRFGLRHPV